jgi:6-pyruvoyltetrahydropterin/6-carboxytetrahydropterin synthase
MLSEPLHPHDFTVVITMDQPLNEEGFVVDYRAVKRTFNRLIGKQLAEKNLDEIFEYPTSENLAKWIWGKLTPFYPLKSIEVREKPHSKAIYFGEAT